MGKSKLKEIFTFEEKKKFTQTLLIIAGILTAFNATPFNINVFVTFIIASLIYLIWISIYEKRSAETKFKRQRLTKIFNSAFSALVGFGFSAMIFTVGFVGSITQGVSIEIAIILWLFIYGELGAIVTIVLVKSKNE